jgi:hypothetical protein
MSRVIGFSEEEEGKSLRVWPDRRWLNPINNAAEPGPKKSRDLAFRNKTAGYTAVEPRVWFSTNYYSISPGMVSLTPGKGAFYAIAFTDAKDDVGWLLLPNTGLFRVVGLQFGLQLPARQINLRSCFAVPYPVKGNNACAPHFPCPLKKKAAIARSDHALASWITSRFPYARRD